MDNNILNAISELPTSISIEGGHKGGIYEVFLNYKKIGIFISVYDDKYILSTFIEGKQPQKKEFKKTYLLKKELNKLKNYCKELKQ